MVIIRANDVHNDERAPSNFGRFGKVVKDPEKDLSPAPKFL